MKRFDQIVGAYYSPEVEALKKRASRSLKISMLTGISAVILFGLLGFMMFFSLLFQYNPLRNPLFVVFLIVGIPTFLILIPTSWVFTFRYIWSCKKAKEAVDDVMRKSIQSEVLPPNGP